MDDLISRTDAKWAVFCNRGNTAAQNHAIDALPTVDAIPAERIKELEQFDYELYCHFGRSHLNEQQWEWLKGMLKNDDGDRHEG